MLEINLFHEPWTEEMYSKPPEGLKSPQEASGTLLDPSNPPLQFTKKRPRKRKSHDRPRLTAAEREWIKNLWRHVKRTSLGRIKKGYGTHHLAKLFRVSEREILKAIQS